MRTSVSPSRTAAVIASALLMVACGDPTAPEPEGLPQLTQESLDRFTAYNITDALVDIYNQNVAGRPSSSYQGQTLSCPNGGTVVITGTVTSSTNSTLNTIDMSYTLSNCKVVKKQTSFTYSGIITEKGSWDNSTNFVSETIKSNGMVTMSGIVTVPGFEDGVVNQTVSFSINRTYSTRSGEIGGRSFTG